MNECMQLSFTVDDVANVAGALFVRFALNLSAVSSEVMIIEKQVRHGTCTHALDVQQY